LVPELSRTSRFIALRLTGREFLRLALVALAYWLAAKLSLNLALVHGQVTPIWPPTGIAVVAILLVGRRATAAIALAAFAVNLPIGPSLVGAAVIAVGNTLAPLLSAELLRRVDFHLQMDRLFDAIAITVAALSGMVVSATIGSLVLVLSGAVPADGFWGTWAVWWTGDAMGVLLVAPFLLSLLPRPAMRRLTWPRVAELGGLLAGTAIVTYLLFQSGLRLVYVVLPLIMATAWRFRQRGAAPAALIASAVAIWSAVHGTGSFASDTLLEKMVTLQAFNVSLALASFVLVAFVETRERQEELARLYAAEQLANQAKSAFLSLAAHELRTPISVLNGYLSMLTDGSLGDDPAAWRRSLEILTAKTRELKTMVDQLLEASRLDISASGPPQAQIDLRDAVRQAVERARARADLLDAEIATGLSAEPVPVKADAVQLGRVLDNLINNGLTYTVRPPRLSIAVSTEDTLGIVRVADNGVGIPETEQELIFERFHRVNDPNFSNVPGTGLGLYISRQVAEGHQGRIVIERSEPGAGTVFALSLPLAQPESRVAPDPSPSPLREPHLSRR
jgi:signal transduction histidine kinase